MTEPDRPTDVWRRSRRVVRVLRPELLREGTGDRAAEETDHRVLHGPAMRALVPSGCRVCKKWIKVGQVQQIVDVPGFGRAWVHSDTCADA